MRVPRRGRVFLAAAVFGLPFTGLAQSSSTCTDKIINPEVTKAVQSLQAAAALTDQGAKDAAVKSVRGNITRALGRVQTLAACSAPLDQSQSLATVLQVRRIDKQVGTSTGGSGSTNLASSGSVPALLGLALEYGGLTEAFNGTTATFSTTPAKLVAAYAKLYGPGTTPPDDKTLRALERVSLAVSFDTSRSDSASTKMGNTLLANYQQLSQASARFLLINDRDPFAPKNWAKILDFARAPEAQEAADLAAELLGPLTKLPGYDQALDKAMNSFDDLVKATPAPDAAALTAIFATYFKELSDVVALVPDWKPRMERYVAARVKADKKQGELYRKIAKAPTLTFNYVLNRPPAVRASMTSSAAGGSATANPMVTPPDLSSANLIYTASLGDSDYTLNVSVNFFNEALPTMRGNFRDFQLSGKWDLPVGQFSPLLSKGTLTFSGLYEHLHQKPLGIDLKINDLTINQPGNIGIFQVKYTIPVGDSGVSVPISFTTSNRTELVKEKENRGNIGITFDLDKLFAKK